MNREFASFFLVHARMQIDHQPPQSIFTRAVESNWEKPISQELLICFLRARKYNVDRAFQSVS